MGKDDQRILAARSASKLKRCIVCTALVLAVAIVPGIPGRVLSAIGSGINADRNGKQWIGTWAAAAQTFLPGSLETYHNQSLRLIVHTSAAGTKVRIKISNTYGDQPLLIGSAHVAR